MIKSKKRVREFGEVFTPEWLVSDMCDLVDKEIRNTFTNILEPCCGNGNFLVEIFRRRMNVHGLCVQHIRESLQTLYGVDIQEDNVYEAKKRLRVELLRVLNGLSDEFLIEMLDIMDKNIVCADWLTDNVFSDVQFDLIITNPPYQKNVVAKDNNKGRADAVYHEFFDKALESSKKKVVFIIPSRWMSKSGNGVPKIWFDKMISSKCFTILHDFPDSKDCFNNIELNGGLCYFVWDNEHDGMCDYSYHTKNKTFVRRGFLDKYGLGIVIRDIQSFSILDKIISIDGWYFENSSFSDIVSTSSCFSYKGVFESNWQDYSLEKKDKFQYKYYVAKQTHGVNYAYVSREQIAKNFELVKASKLFIYAAYGGSIDGKIISKPFLGEPGSLASRSFIMIGCTPGKYDYTEEQLINIKSYVETKFFRYLVKLLKHTQNGSRRVYRMVPMQDFDINWNDEMLYQKYNLTDLEINRIEAAVN